MQAKNQSRTIFVFFLILFMLSFVATLSRPQTPTAPPTKPAPTAIPSPSGADEIDPPKVWNDQLQGFIQLQQLIAQMKEEAGITALENQLQKKYNLLAQSIPSGYTYDQKKQKFVKQAPAPATQAPAQTPAKN